MWTSSESRFAGPIRVGEVDVRHLPPAADAGDPHSDQLVERRLDALQRDHPGGQGRLDDRAGQRGIEAPRGDLDLGQLRHPPG